MPAEQDFPAIRAYQACREEWDKKENQEPLGKTVTKERQETWGTHSPDRWASWVRWGHRGRKASGEMWATTATQVQLIFWYYSVFISRLTLLVLACSDRH